MSKANAIAYLNKVQTDSQYRQSLQARVGGQGVEGVLDIAAADGYVFSAAELRGAAEEASQAQVGVELSDAELDMVAGGGGFTVSVGPQSLQFTVWW